MKSPWKYVSRLLLRSGSSTSGDTAAAENSETVLAATAYSMTPDPGTEVARTGPIHEAIVRSPEPSQLRDEGATVVFVEASVDLPIAPLSPSVQKEQDKSSTASVFDLQDQPKKAVAPTVDLRQSKNRVKAPGNRVSVTSGDSLKHGLAEGKARTQETFFHEVVGVEQDIRQLRLALAQKLASQNQQLKAMLSRFDAQ